MSARNSLNLRRWGKEWGGPLDMARRWKIECFVGLLVVRVSFWMLTRSASVACRWLWTRRRGSPRCTRWRSVARRLLSRTPWWLHWECQALTVGRCHSCYAPCGRTDCWRTVPASTATSLASSWSTAVSCASVLMTVEDRWPSCPVPGHWRMIAGTASTWSQRNRSQMFRIRFITAESVLRECNETIQSRSCWNVVIIWMWWRYVLRDGTWVSETDSRCVSTVTLNCTAGTVVER